jgi:hypothetical protein
MAKQGRSSLIDTGSSLICTTRAMGDFMHSTGGKIAGFALIGIGGADLILGNTSTPLPVVGQYLTQQIDLVLIGIGVVILVFF